MTTSATTMARTRTIRTATAFLLGMALYTHEMKADDLMTPETLWSMHRVGSYTVSPDGGTVAYTVTTPDIAANRNVSSILTISIDGTGRKVLSEGDKS